MSTYQVIVGGLGETYSGGCPETAWSVYDHYHLLSKSGWGRVAHESVVLFEDDEIVAETRSKAELEAREDA